MNKWWYHGDLHGDMNGIDSYKNMNGDIWMNYQWNINGVWCHQRMIHVISSMAVMGRCPIHGARPQASSILMAGWWARATPLKNMSSSIGMISNPTYGKIKNGNQTTNQMGFPHHPAIKGYPHGYGKLQMEMIPNPIRNHHFEWWHNAWSSLLTVSCLSHEYYVNLQFNHKESCTVPTNITNCSWFQCTIHTIHTMFIFP